MMDDHKHHCAGRDYTCTCGYDAERDAEIERLRIKADLYDIHCHHRGVLTERLETAEAVIAAARDAIGNCSGSCRLDIFNTYDKDKTND